ncbi:hypothetical protein Bca52824_049865, partial [Brassica carinata]
IFITNLKPVKFWDFVSHIVEGLGYPRPSTKLPVPLVSFVLSLLKWTQEKEGTGSYYDTAHQFALLASSTRTFNCNAAKKHLGYTPVVTLEDGIASTVQWFSRDLEKSDDTAIQSKADQLLGCGKVADILLWRNEKNTFVSFVVLNLLYYWFFSSGSTFTSSAAQLLFILAVALYGLAFVPSKIFGFLQVKKIPPWRFEIPESAVRDLSRDIVVAWNHGVHSLNSLSRGGDWIKFFKIAGSLYLLKLIVSRSLATFLFTAMSFSFTAFFIYEQYEVELYHLARILIECLTVVKETVVKNLPLPDASSKPMFIYELLQEEEEEVVLLTPSKIGQSFFEKSELVALYPSNDKYKNGKESDDDEDELYYGESDLDDDEDGEFYSDESFSEDNKLHTRTKEDAKLRRRSSEILAFSTFCNFACFCP